MARIQPYRRMTRLHRGVDHSQELADQRIAVDLVPETGPEALQGLGRVVLGPGFGRNWVLRTDNRLIRRRRYLGSACGGRPRPRWAAPDPKVFKAHEHSRAFAALAPTYKRCSISLQHADRASHDGSTGSNRGGVSIGTGGLKTWGNGRWRSPTATAVHRRRRHLTE